MKINKYILLAIIYFFFNSLFLPHGLLYTILLTPVFYYQLVKDGKKNILAKFAFVFLPFFLIHLSLGVELFFYIRSMVLVFTTYIFGYSVHNYIRKRDLAHLFTPLLKINFILLVLALILYHTSYIELLWTVRNLTIELSGIPRLQLFTYEPSYYSLLLAPIALYYLLKFLLKPTSWSTLIGYSFLILLPLLLSFSLGVLSCLIFTLTLMLMFNFKHLIKQKRIFYQLLLMVMVGLSTFILLIVIYPDNPLFLRVVDLFEGKDISASGRTTNAFYLASEIAKQKSGLFGVGLGQIKVVGAEIIRLYYHYHITDLASIRIPNTVAETAAMFGLIGLLIRLGLQIYLFFKTKVYSNYYRLSIFIFVFIYQFTGSFFNNIAEIVLWVIAFTPCCEIFDKAIKPRTED